MRTPQNPRFSDTFDLNLTIISRIRSGQNPSGMCVDLGMKKSALQYHLNRLKRWNILVKKGYGVWEVNEENVAKLGTLLGRKEVQKIEPRVSRVPGQKKTPLLNFSKAKKIDPDSIRTHALGFTVKIKKVYRWNRSSRCKYMQKKGIQFDPIQQGERLFVFGNRVWLTDNSIVVWLSGSYFAPDPETGHSYGITELQKLLIRLEQMFGRSFRMGGSFQFRAFQGHHAMVKNVLAIQHNREGQKLNVSDHKGRWLVIDNSENLDEMEVIRAKGEKPTELASFIQDWWNDVKDTRVKQSEILGMIQASVKIGHQNQEQMQFYAENIKAHAQAVQDISKGQKKMNELLEKIGDKL